MHIKSYLPAQISTYPQHLQAFNTYNCLKRVWRYQRGNQNPYIEEKQTTCPTGNYDYALTFLSRFFYSPRVTENGNYEALVCSHTPVYILYSVIIGSFSSKSAKFVLESLSVHNSYFLEKKREQNFFFILTCIKILKNWCIVWYK